MKGQIVIDMQYGSTGKGLICGVLAEETRPDVVVAAWGPNAGHTWIDRKGKKAIVTMLPIGAHTRNCRAVLLGPGSVIDLDALAREVRHAVTEFGAGFRIIIHPAAVVVTEDHREAERKHVSIGSTMKGNGAALIEKIMRNPHRSPLVRDLLLHDDTLGAFSRIPAQVLVDEHQYMYELEHAQCIQVEGAQGFSLGVHRSRFWPYCTSREVTPAQIISDCAIPWRIARALTVVGTIRTLPIRVANRYDKDLKQIGTSGPCYPDQKELDWGTDLGMEPELTTVTKLPRRIFSFSRMQLQEAVHLCSPDEVFINFCNYVSQDKLAEIVRAVQAAGTYVHYLGYGPTADDVVDIGDTEDTLE